MLFTINYSSKQFLRGHSLLRAALPNTDTTLGVEPAFAVLVDRLQEQPGCPVGFGKKNEDMTSRLKQMPTFIFGIASWSCGEMSVFMQNQGQEIRRLREWKP